MMIIRKPLAILGISICLFAGLCPILRVPIKGNWNLYQTDVSLFFITYFLILLTAFTFFIRQLSGFRIMSRILLCWYILAISAVYFKINHYFGWKFADRILAKGIHFQWGWIVLLLGILTLLWSTKNSKVIKD